MAMNAMRLVAIFVWAAVCFLTGCGTLARVGSYGDPSSLHSEFAAFYPATDYDLVAISSGGRDWLAGHHADTVSGWNLALVVPLHIVDLPISLATDTLCLPWDIVEAIESHKEQTTTAPSPSPSFAVSQLKGWARPTAIKLMNASDLYVQRIYFCTLHWGCKNISITVRLVNPS